MTKLSTGIKNIAIGSRSAATGISGCYNGVTKRLNNSYRYTRIGCKKLQRKLRQGVCQITERNRDMAQEALEQTHRAARQSSERSDSDITLIMMTFMMMMGNINKPEPIPVPIATYDAPELGM